MHKRISTFMLTATAALLAGMTFTGCDDAAAQSHGSAGHAQHAQANQAGFENIAKAVAVLHPTEGNEAQGVVRFEALDGGKVRVTARFENLEAGSTHAFHVHEFGDCTAPDATSAGGHYNPEGHPHGLPNGAERHAGDFGNVTVGENGVAELDLTVDNLSIAGAENPVLGRGVILHAQRDDGSQPTGDAGARLACGVVGVANAAE